MRWASVPTSFTVQFIHVYFKIYIIYILIFEIKTHTRLMKYCSQSEFEIFKYSSMTDQIVPNKVDVDTYLFYRNKYTYIDIFCIGLFSIEIYYLSFTKKVKVKYNI